MLECALMNQLGCPWKRCCARHWPTLIWVNLKQNWSGQVYIQRQGGDILVVLLLPCKYSGFLLLPDCFRGGEESNMSANAKPTSGTNSSSLSSSSSNSYSSSSNSSPSNGRDSAVFTSSPEEGLGSVISPRDSGEAWPSASFPSLSRRRVSNACDNMNHYQIKIFIGVSDGCMNPTTVNWSGKCRNRSEAILSPQLQMDLNQ